MGYEESALASLLTPDTLTPEQWADGRRARNQSPEARVALALLHDAVDCLHYRNIKTGHKQRLYKEAMAWLAGEGDPPVTAESCCEMLGWNIEYLRRGLQSYMPKKLYAGTICRNPSQLRPQDDSTGQPRRPRSSRTSPITPEEALRIVDMYRAGAPFPDIRKAVGVSDGTIYKIVNQALKPKEKRPAGRAATMEAKREQIRQMRERGIGINEIARQMQVGSKTVYDALEQETVETSPQPGPANEAVQLGLYD